ncbi:hypothetical protein U91I_01113 [alpha proteobacterium U9-1i]|nr:hypothetical protein U91I_01113 [alpha proteobacterium U9-1i]
MTDWAEALVAAARRDLETRARLAQGGALFEGYHPEMEAIHLENALLLDRVFDELGWPGRAKITDDGAAAATLILQHAISAPALQRRGLALLLDAVAEGEANALDAAYLSDRIAVLEGRPQLFGTQFDWDDAGLLSPAPIAEAELVDERRASVGLAPMTETIAAMRAQAAAEGDAAPGDLATRRAEYEAWARKAGWRA